MVQLKEKFGKRVQLLRNEAGITQAEMAYQTGLSIETISHIERGVYGTKFEFLEKFAEALNVEVKDLFEFGE